jgi:ribonuclease E
MTRQRVQPSLERSTYTDCPYCKGSGILKHPESVALEVMRHLKLLVSRDQIAVIDVMLHPQVADHINNAKRTTLARMEADTHKRIHVKSNPEASIDHASYRCLDDRGSEVRADLPLPPAPPPLPPPPPEEPSEAETPLPDTPEE